MIKDSTCRNVHLNRVNYKCKLTCSLVRCYIDLDRYEPLKIKFETKEICLTATLLLDYGLLHQIIFTNLRGQRQVICLLNMFIRNKRRINAIIISKPPE